MENCADFPTMDTEEKAFLCETQARNIWTSETFEAASIGKVAKRRW